MQAINPAYHVEILGINLIGREVYNVAYTSGTSLPWLQDVPEQDVRTSWMASDRDVYILNPMNEVVAVYNLYTHDLSLESNRNALKALFLQAADWRDTDNSTPTGDPDKDGTDNFTEYAFGTDPLDPNSSSSMQTMVVTQGGDRFLAIGFARRMGSQLSYAEESSTNLSTWSDPGGTVILDEPLQNIFDGSGTGRTSYRTATPISSPLPWFFRMRALP